MNEKEIVQAILLMGQAWAAPRWALFGANPGGWTFETSTPRTVGVVTAGGVHYVGDADEDGVLQTPAATLVIPGGDFWGTYQTNGAIKGTVGTVTTRNFRVIRGAASRPVLVAM